MRTLAIVFLCLAVYGGLTGNAGAGLLALLMSLLMVYGARQLRKRDVEYYTDPAHAKAEPDTLKVLAEQACECSGSRF
jgi:hypothetical protein